MLLYKSTAESRGNQAAALLGASPSYNIVQMDLHGRTALVTGSAVRIGRQICIELGQHGANIVINYRSSATAAGELVIALEHSGVHALAVQADVSISADVARLATEDEAAFGQVDLLVN